MHKCEAKCAAIGRALEEIVVRACSGKKICHLGLMAAGSELPIKEFLFAAQTSMDADPSLRIAAIGPLPEEPLPEGMDWIETVNCDADAAKAMEKLLSEGKIDGAVALHYPFPMGVTTVGRIIRPATGLPMYMASCTGMSASKRAESMLRNAILGAGVARALGVSLPILGILNLDAASQVAKALSRMIERGYPIKLGTSIRHDGGFLLRGNDVLCGTFDVCVTDTLTGNVLMKLLSSFTSGGARETCGWGYGPSVGEGWDRVVSIVSRASSAPVIAGALLYTAQAVRLHLPQRIQEEFTIAKDAGLDLEISSLNNSNASIQEITPPSATPVDTEIYGIDVLELENAVYCLWHNKIYAEAAMGCTGPIIKLSSVNREKAIQYLSESGYL